MTHPSLKLLQWTINWYTMRWAFSGASSITAPRLLCTLGADACAEVIEEFVGPAKGAEAHFCNAVAEFDLAERTQLRHG